MAYRNISVWLEDILKAIEKIEIYFTTIYSLKDLLSSRITIDATERNLEIIAEALKRSIKLQPQLPISNAKKNNWLAQYY
ncbi:MAG: HepT-like ribonuclease domain-containing protein [Chitinophagaceae bacterium]